MKFIKKSTVFLTILLMLSTMIFAKGTKAMSFSNIMAENDAIYITPASLDVDSMENFDNSLSTEVKLIYNNEYYEAILLRNNDLSVFLTISNSGMARKLVCYIAEYDSTGKLIELTSNDTIFVPAGETIAANLTKALHNPSTASAKIFLWDENNLQPITSGILLQSQQVDYYADTYTSAQNYDMSKTINGKINTTSDIDYIKLVPASTGKYIVNATSSANVSGGLYDSKNNLIVSGTSLDGGYYCGAELVSGNTYYLKTNGNTVGEYKITITKMKDDGLVEITNDSIKLMHSCNSTSPINVTLYSSDTVVQSVSVVPNNNKVSAEIDVGDLQSSYTITVTESGVVTAIYDIKTITDSNTYEITDKSYVAVPMMVSNVSDLSHIYFSVAFIENEFDVFDVCEHTYTSSETGTGFISDAEVNIKSIENNAVIFTSLKELSEPWSGNVNTVKLQANGTGEYTVKTIAYSVK